VIWVCHGISIVEDNKHCFRLKTVALILISPSKRAHLDGHASDNLDGLRTMDLHTVFSNALYDIHGPSELFQSPSSCPETQSRAEKDITSPQSTIAQPLVQYRSGMRERLLYQPPSPPSSSAGASCGGSGQRLKVWPFSLQLLHSTRDQSFGCGQSRPV